MPPDIVLMLDARSTDAGFKWRLQISPCPCSSHIQHKTDSCRSYIRRETFCLSLVRAAEISRGRGICFPGVACVVIKSGSRNKLFVRENAPIEMVRFIYEEECPKAESGVS